MAWASALPSAATPDPPPGQRPSIPGSSRWPFALSAATRRPRRSLLLTFNSFFAALTCWTIYRTALRVFNENGCDLVGLDLGAAIPTPFIWAVRWIWETSLSAFLLSLLFMLTVEMEGDDRSSSWIGYGLLWGIAALTNPAALSFLPFAGCWLAYQLHRRGKRFLVPVLFSAVVFWMTIMPWLVRNYEAMGQFVFIRDNFGNELRIAQ